MERGRERERRRERERERDKKRRQKVKIRKDRGLQKKRYLHFFGPRRLPILKLIEK